MQDKYNILDKLKYLSKSKASRTKWCCPVCGGNDLDINPKTGAYACFSGGCPSSEIRKEIDQLEGKNPYNPIPKWQKSVLEDDDAPVPFRKSPRSPGKKEYAYPTRDGSPLMKVSRIDKSAGGKSFCQSHWDGKGYQKGCPEEVRPNIAIYRYTEVRSAIAEGKTTLVVEGEKTADLLWENGIPATTTIGGSGGYSTYGKYADDLKGAKLILCPDRDANGLKYMANFAKDFSSQIEGYYLCGALALWAKPKDKMDIGDEISDGLIKSLDDVLGKVISADEFYELTSSLESETDKQKQETYSPDGTALEGGKPHFLTSFEKGLKFETSTRNESGEWQRSRTQVGSHLEAIAYCESPENAGAMILVEFRSIRGNLRRISITRGMLSGDGIEAVRLLADRGYHFIRKQKSLLLDYLFGLGREVDRVYSIADKSGWMNGSFLTPGKTYGDPNLRFRDPEPDNSFCEIKGSLDEWKSGVGAKCAGNSRLIFSLGAVFAATLLEPTQIESGGFHLVGTTSIGKTTTLNVAASVSGLKNVPSWRSTSNALEGKAAEFNHCLLPLDEIGQADPQAVGAAAYMLGNGQGKARMTKNLGTLKPKMSLLLFLSTGETSMTAYLAQAKIAAKGGMEARMPSIPADAGKGFGAFENIHEFDSPKAFVDALETSIRNHRGSALDAYLTRLVEARKVEGFDKRLRERVHSIGHQLSQQFADTAIGRVAVRFGLVQAALELAHSYGLLPFPIEDCGWSVGEMFADWVGSRGGDGSIEMKEACNKIRHLFESSQHGDRIYDVESRDPVVRQLLAYKVRNSQTDTTEYLVPPAIFNKELADGVDRSQLIAKLQEMGWIESSTEKDRNTVKRTVLDKRRSFFAFHEFWVEGEEDAFGDDEKAAGHAGHAGQQAETLSYSHPSASHEQRDNENLNGTRGTATGYSNALSTCSPVREIVLDSAPDTAWTPLESSSGATLENHIPCVPEKKPNDEDDIFSDLRATECNPVNPSPSVSQPLGKEKNCRFKRGDRVRYVGGMIKHQGKSGTIVKVCVDPYVCDYSYVCDFGDKLTEQLPVSELEVA